MNCLNRKLIRELAQSKAQSLAIGLVIASGVAVFVMSLGTLAFLKTSRDAYYDRYRLADIFASLSRAPNSVAEQIADIEGVARVQTRIVSDVTLDVPGLVEPAVGRLISLPDTGSPVLNRVHLRSGRLPEPLRESEVLASEAFVEANGLRLGDSVDAVLNGRLQPLRIVGVALSPEYVFQIRGGDILPDDKRFGVFWMRRQQLEAAFDMDGGFNNVTLRLLRGVNPDGVIEQLDQILRPYGAVGAIAREDQISVKFLNDEIKSLKATALVAPVIFLGVAAFLLNVVLSRRIATQRSVIATLKAFGYSNRQIGWHYLKSALLVSLVGASLGAIGGYRMGIGLAELYSEFYRFPGDVYRPDFRAIAGGILISGLAASCGAWYAVRKAARMKPAEAMRPLTPRGYRRSWLERLGLAPLLPLVLRMTLRSLQRRPLNAALSAIGIGSAVSVLLLSNFASDSLDYLIRFQFETAQRHDVQVNFYQLTSPAADFDLQNLPGVETVEPYRSVAAKLRHRHYDYRTGILGLEQRRDLYQLVDVRGKAIRLPESGLVLGDKLAERLRVRPGDELIVEVLEGSKPVLNVPLAAVTTEYAGMNAYMDRHELHRLMRETDALSGAFLAVDQAEADNLYRQLKRTPRVASVAVKRATVERFRETIAENQLTMQSFTMFFAAVIAVGVVYNTARIAVDERSRELATLRVIGFTRAEVSGILLTELAIITSFAIPIGWIGGYLFCFSMVKGFESELFRIPLVIDSSSYAKSGLVVALAAAVSGLLVRRRLDHLDLVAVLKSQE